MLCGRPETRYEAGAVGVLVRVTRRRRTAAGERGRGVAAAEHGPSGARGGAEADAAAADTRMRWTRARVR